jgi:diguanylate cyclase (GGDEF)-like protein/PAS domain S-box-containing protein
MCGALLSEVEPTMSRSRFLKDVPLLAALAVVYFAAGKFGLKLASVNASATAVWPCTGIALTAFLILGYRVWPGILAGAFLVNVTTAGSAATSIGIAVGNTLEGVVGCYLVSRFAGGLHAFQRARDIFKFAFLAGMVSTTVSATVGVTTLALGGFAEWAMFGAIWSTWWLGDAVGAVVVTPFLLLWWENPRLNWTRDQMIELAFWFLGLSFTAWIVFGGRFQSGQKNYPLEYFCVPFLIWAAFRFGRRKAATAICALAAVATWGTLHGFGPFSRESQNTSLLLLQSFMGIMAITTMALAAEISQHKRAAERFRVAIESAPNAMVMIDRQGKIVMVNSHAMKMFGYMREELVGRPVEVLVPERFRGGHPEHRKGFSSSPRARPMGAGRDLYAVRKDGSEFPVEIGLNPIETEEGLLVLSAIVDISERKRAEEQILRLVTSDPLTGLANYRKLIEVLDSEIKRYGRTSKSFAIILLDLDGLKKINDAYGHLTGSRALCRLAAILRLHSRGIDAAARYGGDEFVLVLPETESKGAEQVAHRISERLGEEGEHPRLSVSTGTAIYPQDGLTLEELLGAADRALYEKKGSQKKKLRTPS